MKKINSGLGILGGMMIMLYSHFFRGPTKTTLAAMWSHGFQRHWFGNLPANVVFVKWAYGASVIIGADRDGKFVWAIGFNEEKNQFDLEHIEEDSARRGIETARRFLRVCRRAQALNLLRRSRLLRAVCVMVRNK